MMLPVGGQLAQGALYWIAASSAKTSVVLVLAFMATRRRATSASTRHAIWAASVVTAVAIPVAQLMLPAWDVAILPAVRRADTAVAIASLPHSGALVSNNSGRLSVEAGPSATSTLVPPMVNRVDAYVVTVPTEQAPAAVEARAWDAALAPATPARRAPLGWPDVMFSLWLLGALIVLSPWALGVRRRTYLWRRALPDLAAEWSNTWRYIPTSVNRVIRVRTSDLTTVPMTWGVFTPVILTPPAPHWTAAQRRAAMLHELAHIARFDTVWQGISRLMLGLFWFNPLAWIADAMLRAESERACDDAVLRAGTRASEYAQQLLEVVRTGGEGGMHAVAAMSMARRSGMAERLRALLDARQQRGRLPRRLQLSLVVVSGVVAIPAARLTPVAAHPALLTTRALASSSQRNMIPGRLQTTENAGPPTHSTSVLPLPRVNAEEAQAAPGIGGSAFARMASAFGISAMPAPAVRNLMTALPPVSGFASWVATPVGPGLAQGEDCLNLRRTSSSSHSSESHTGRLKNTRVKWTQNDCRVTFDLEGDVMFNADATDVIGLSRGGSLELQVKDGTHTRRVQLDDKNGGIERQFWVDGDRKAWDSAAATWFTGALVAIDRRTAFAADQRLPVLLKKGGVEAALSEIELMYSDYAQRLYYTKLFKLQPLSVAQIRRVLIHVGLSLDSDYERAELLLAIAKLDVFHDEAYVDYANAASGITSAYEKRRALSALLAEKNLKPAAVKALLEAAHGMDSDYELAELLVGVAKQYAISDDTRPLYLAALGSLESDYEHRRVLDTIVQGGGLTPTATRALLKAASSIESDYELAEFLVHLAAAGSLDASNADEFFAAHATIAGDYESHRVLTALIKGGRIERDVLLRVLKAANTLNSDYERASLLVEVASVGKMDDAMRAVYEKAAEGVKSEYEYGRAMSALRKSTRSF
jgi:beta-lactamase regulating signal transducer with metallopeptidase domain